MKDNLLTKLFWYFTILVFSIITIIFTIKSYLIFAILAYLVVLFIALKTNIKKFPVILFITSLVIRLVLINVINYSSFDDYKTLIKASWKFANHDYSFANTTYFKMWGYQTGLVIYQGTILKIFGSEMAIKIINSIVSSLTVLLVYYVSKKLTNEKVAKISSILYMILPISLIMNAMLNNQILSAFLMYIGIYFLIKKETKIKDYIIAGVLISIGNILRPEGIIVIFSLIVFEILRLKKDKILDVSKKLVVFLAVYFLIGNISSLLIIKTGINSKGLSNLNTTWKFVLGFNYNTCGYYDPKDEKYLGNIEKEKEVVKERLSHTDKIASLMACKIDHFWLMGDSNTKSEEIKSQTYQIMGKNISYDTIENIALKYNKHIYIVTLFMCIVGVVFNRKKIKENNSIFFVIMIITTFCVYLLIELRPRYSYFIQISIFILSSYGYNYIIEKIQKRKEVIE